MAVYAIGDIQGCYDPLRRLLDKLKFKSDRDKLWFTGDLVNRGPKSLKVLRFVRSLDNNAITVLGNHDLHLLAVSEFPERRRRKDTLNNILDAPDRDELLYWLRHRPLLHHDKKLDFTLVHAGLAPKWDLNSARAAATELESVLQGDRYQDFLRQMYGDAPDDWSKNMKKIDRLRYITNCLTRMRFCDRKGRLELSFKGRPRGKNWKYVPWFRVPGRANRKLRIVFGHWSTLGPVTEKRIFPLDSGCVWGGCLTALRLDGKKMRHRVTRCKEYRQPV
jgi:bis(5'-nucleosyl)-tetraphosphatase (symmetrical)